MRAEYPSLRQGLVGAWCPSLGASGLSLIDRSGRNNHGTLTNMAGQDNWRASGSGVALNFDGTNDYVSASAPIVDNKVTLLAWAYFASVPTNYPMVLQWRQSGSANSVNTFAILHRPAGDTYGGASGSRIMFVANGALVNTTFPTVPLVAAKWNCYCGVFDGTTQSLYVNGVVAGSSGVTSAVSVTSAIRLVEIGNNAALTSDGYFNGQVDDVRLYNRALTPAEIRLLASRRGIGLTPLPDRAAGLPRKLSVNVEGTWRASDAYVNVGGAWKLGQASTNVAGVWK
jgi:hypothetical protein